ncbi:helix-turn-helix domain-containing protein [Streptomyces sp. HNM0574]|nr:peptidoglycan-binding protein [Streptomyces sp. HNM0574]NLU66824.1 helix-turn-helix domain-containing protein [Streptomyces sp. HNM0574]
MPRWKELPDTVDHRVRQLVVHLRRMKDHSGLSLAALAAKTTYSKSSWERYLNAKTLPPRGAVEELARVAGADPTRLLALHEVCEAARESAPPADPALPEPEVPGSEDVLDGTGDDGGRRWTRARLIAVGAGAVAVLGAAGLLLALAPWSDEAERDPRITAHEGPYVWEPGTTYRCDIQRHDGRTYAGHSVTRTALMEYNSTTWDVVEAQCLLRAAGYQPGAIDGVYRNGTERAVKRLQSDAGIPDDGKVGPDTWKVLRR